MFIIFIGAGCLGGALAAVGLIAAGFPFWLAFLGYSITGVVGTLLSAFVWFVIAEAREPRQLRELRDAAARDQGVGRGAAKDKNGPGPFGPSCQRARRVCPAEGGKSVHAYSGSVL